MTHYTTSADAGAVRIGARATLSGRFLVFAREEENRGAVTFKAI